MNSTPMTIEQRSADGVTILEIRGNMTIDTLREMVVVDTVRSLLAQGRKYFVMNLAAVPYVDTMGCATSSRRSSRRSVKARC